MNRMVQHPFRRGAAQRTTFGYLTDTNPKLDKFQNAISALSGVLSMLALLGIILLTLADVFLRTVFHFPQGWIAGIITDLLLPATAFFGIVTAYRSGAHVAIVSLFNKFAEPVKKLALLFGYLVVAVSLLLILVGGWRAMSFAFQLGQVTPPGMADLQIPDWILAAPLPTAAALGLVLVLIDIYREVFSSWRHPATDYDPGDELAEVDPDGPLGFEERR